MGLCVVIALIAAAMGLGSKYLENANAEQRQAKLDKMWADLEDAHAKYASEEADLRILRAAAREVVRGKVNLIEALPRETPNRELILQVSKQLDDLVK
jgi:hypothetical protein